MPIVEILVGHIASGKTTYSIKRAKEGAIIIDHDSIVMSCHAGIYQLYDELLKPLYSNIQHTMFDMALVLNKDVVIDKTNLKRSSRIKYIEAAKDRATINAIIFPFAGAETHALRRFSSDNRGYDYQKWLSVAKEHENLYEPVTKDEGFNKIIYIKNDGNY